MKRICSIALVATALALGASEAAASQSDVFCGTNGQRKPPAKQTFNFSPAVNGNIPECGPKHKVPDAASTASLLAAGMVGLVALRRWAVKA